MTGYLIKATYLTGPHKGKSYLLNKGGYVTESTRFQHKDTTYKTLGFANRECKRLTEKYTLDYKIERQDNDYRISQGKSAKEFFIYEQMSFEPYPVEVFG